MNIGQTVRVVRAEPLAEIVPAEHPAPTEPAEVTSVADVTEVAESREPVTEQPAPH